MAYKLDCPHVDDNVFSYIVEKINDVNPCAKCQDVSDNWICCKCGEIYCSRNKSAHMLEHNKDRGHLVATSFSDSSCWCYACERIIKHSSLNRLLDALQKRKRSSLKEAANNNENGGMTSLFSKLSLKAPDLPTILSSLTLEGIADYIKSGRCNKIVVMTGAGVSVASGIPDFRTPGTGLYDNLQRFNLPYPTAVFEIEYFQKNPDPFFVLAKGMFPGTFAPTHVHYFIRLLHEKGLLLRNYTQNIDTLERMAGVPPEALVEAHGTYATAHCMDCKKEYTREFVKDAIFANRIPRCESCKGVVKPDVVLFGEPLPHRFVDMMSKDFPMCDLLIVIGTSLKVQPFAALVKMVSTTTPRLLINMKVVGTSYYPGTTLPSFSTGFLFNHVNNIRDVKHLGDCQAGVKALAALLGWEKELEALVEEGKKQFGPPSISPSSASSSSTAPSSSPTSSPSSSATSSPTTPRSTSTSTSTSTSPSS